MSNSGASNHATSSEQPEVAIIVGRGNSIPDNVSPALQALAARGVKLKQLIDGDKQMLNFDRILLVGILRRYSQTRELFRRHGIAGKQVIAWTVEPLLPVGLNPWWRRIGLALTSSALGVSTAPIVRRLFRVPYFLISLVGLGRYNCQIIGTETQFAFEQTAWVEGGLSEGYLTGLLVSTGQKRNAMQSIGWDSVFAPVGESAAFGHDLGLERDLDVLFIGRPTSRWRIVTLRRIVRQLRQRGISVSVRTGGVYGEQRTELLNRTRIVLHLHKYPWDTPWMRWYLATANGAVVASQPLNDPAPLRPNIDYLSAEPDKLAEEIARLLDDEERRRTMLDNCRNTMKQEMSMDQTVDKILAALDLSSLVHREPTP